MTLGALLFALGVWMLFIPRAFEHVDDEYGSFDQAFRIVVGTVTMVAGLAVMLSGGG